jgi:regulator of CtrA degradation
MSTTFFNRTYDETMALLVEAREYVAFREKLDRETRAIRTRLAMSCEAMRVTSRLTQVMAWLLVQKAVHAGELSHAEAAEDHRRLSGHGVCMDTRMAEIDDLPDRLRSLLERSYRLYERVARLDTMAAGSSGAAEA